MQQNQKIRKWCGREAQNICFSSFVKTHFSYIFQLYKVQDLYIFNL